MDGRVDERPDTFGNSFGNLNLERKFGVAIWNFRSLRPKAREIAEILEKREIDVCAFQETKTEGDFDEQDYKLKCFAREKKHNRLGFAVRNSVKVLETKRVSDRVALNIVQKRNAWTSSPNKDNPLQKKFYQKRNPVTD